MTQITREEIERWAAWAAQDNPVPPPHWSVIAPKVRRLLDHALSEPERIAQAERRGAEAMRGKCVDVAHMLAKTIRAAGRGEVAEWTANHIAVALSHATFPGAPAELDRIEAARREGEAAGIERAARYVIGDGDSTPAWVDDCTLHHDGRHEPAYYAGLNDAAEAIAEGLRSLPTPASSDEVTWEEASEIAVRIAMGRQTEKAPAEPSAPVAPEPAIRAIEQGRTVDPNFFRDPDCDEDMAAVGRDLMEALRDNSTHARIVGWAPNNSPAEIVVDMLNWLADETARIAALEAEVAALREGLKDVLASLVATVSLLGRIPNARLAAPSNKMFEQMMLDYEASIERARSLLQGQGGDDAAS